MLKMSYTQLMKARLGSMGFHVLVAEILLGPAWPFLICLTPTSNAHIIRHSILQGLEVVGEVVLELISQIRHFIQ